MPSSQFQRKIAALLVSLLIFSEGSLGFQLQRTQTTSAARTKPFSLLYSVPNNKGADYLFTSNGENGYKISTTEERHLRFAGVGRLYTTTTEQTKQQEGSLKQQQQSNLPPHLQIVERLTESTVMVIGLGGVGSWAAEALCRSGVGNLILVDLDDICISNINRQLHATSSTVGQMKLDEMKRRLEDINPQCNVTLVHDFISPENIDEIIDDSSKSGLTALLDAMDGTKEKTALLAACVNRRIPVVTCGGAAGRVDPSSIVVEDLTRVSNDKLLGTCRKNLRKFYDFEKGLSFQDIQNKKKKPRKWNIFAVTSTETPRKVCQSDTSSFRRCDGPLGTACFVTGTYGFVAAARIVDMIANNQLVRPRLQGEQHAGASKAAKHINETAIIA